MSSEFPHQAGIGVSPWNADRLQAPETNGFLENPTLIRPVHELFKSPPTLFGRWADRNTSGDCDALDWLAGELGYQLEVFVEVKDSQAGEFGGGREE